MFMLDQFGRRLRPDADFPTVSLTRGSGRITLTDWAPLPASGVTSVAVHFPLSPQGGADVTVSVHFPVL
jgi:hypothetical protein